MLGTKIFVAIFSAMRCYAVVFSKFVDADNELDDSCFTTNRVNEVSITVQTPFATGCMGTLDKSLIVFTGLASIGVAVCTVLVFLVGFEHFRIFHQSHYTGRVNVTTISSATPSVQDLQTRLGLKPFPVDPIIEEVTNFEEDSSSNVQTRITC